MRRKLLIFGVLALGLLLLGLVRPTKESRLLDPSASAQSGAGANDGDLVVTSPNTIVNRYATLAMNAPAGSSRILVTYPGGEHGLRADLLAPGDLILIVQMAGASINNANNPDYGQITNLNNAGRYEFVAISRADGGLITLNPPCGGLLNDYSVNGRVQIIRVPRYNTLTIAAGATLTAPAWNGSFGGIVALNVANNAVINGEINMSGRGFRGGISPPLGGVTNRSEYVTGQQDFGAEKGEGIAGYQAGYDQFGGRFARGAAANAGGGGTAHNTGGGGGANGDNGSVWTGHGVMDGATIGAAAWRNDPAYIANGNQLTTSSGGGRGGYSYAEFDRDALTVGPGDESWGGDRRRNVGGLGGRPMAQTPASRIFMGGGGGGGAQNDLSGGSGGNAGGMIYLIAGAVSGTGQLVANGNPGEDTRNQNRDGAGGGGAGGTIVVYSNTLSGVKAEARGGKGGDQRTPIQPNPVESQGPGGGGGGGFVAYRGGSISADVSGGIGGRTGSIAQAEFPANGATGGAIGAVQTNLTAIPFCSGTADLAVTNSNNASTVIPGLPVTYTVTVTNNGPSAIYGVDVTDTLPAGFVPATKAWTCRTSTGSDCSAPAGTGDLAAKVNLLINGVATFTLTALLDPAYTGVVNTRAQAILPPGGTDPNPANNAASDNDVATPRADLSVTMIGANGTVAPGGGFTSSSNRFVPGTNVTFQIEIRNLGPSVATGFGISNQLPNYISLVSANCVATDGNCGVNTTTGNLVQLAGQSLGVSSGNINRITIVGFINPSATGTLTNTAALIIPPVNPVGGTGTSGNGFFDPNTSSNSSTVQGVLAPEANLAITKTNNQTTVTAGNPTTYQIDITNLGPSDATGFDITDNLPAALTVTSFTCVATGGSCGTNATSGNLLSYTNASLPAGAGRSLRLLVTGTVRADAAGQLSNTANITLPAGASFTDPVPGNNAATDSDQIIQQADLAVTMAGPTGNLFAGNRATYTIVVSNRGPSKALGAAVTNPLPPTLDGATWTCQATAGSTCGAATGTGGVNTTLNLELNGQATIVLTATVSRNFGGTLVNQVLVAPPSGTTDPVQTNNDAASQITVIRSEGPTFFIGQGLSKIVISQPFRIALDAAGLSRLGTGNARLSNQTLNMPVESGAIDLFNGTGEIHHSGGLSLWIGNNEIQILSLTIDTSTDPAVVSGIVLYSSERDKRNTGSVLGRVKLADLKMPSSVVFPIRPAAFNTLYFHQATFVMSDELATLLNFYFGGTNFRAGLDLGTISTQLIGVPERFRQ
ncbi:MAG: hypothetical protein ACK5RR_09385 [Acidobacteriota bacterium]